MSTLEVKAIQAPSGYKLAMPAGHILQVKQVNTSGASGVSISSRTFADITGLSESITPSSTSNKILIQASVHMYLQDYSTSQWKSVDYRIVRTVGGSSTNVAYTYEDDGTGSDYGYTYGFWNVDANERGMCVVPVQFLDSPNTTSSATYKIQAHSGANGNNGAVVSSSGGYGISTMTLMEVQG